MHAFKFPIEHVIVLMLENHSYDHMFGYLANGHGLTGQEYNLVDPADLSSEKVYVSNRSNYIMEINPAHDIPDVERQIYGRSGQILDPTPMNGFVMVQTEMAKGNVEEGKKIMECFDPDKIPALTTLAREFLVCDRWHSSVPGPTWLNRFFVQAATCDGVGHDDATHIYQMKTIFDTLAESGYTWNVYYGDIPQSILLQHGSDRVDHFKPFHKYYEDLGRGELATYTFIEPRFMDFFHWKATDQHPPHDVSLGEYLIAEVYDTLRASAYWEKSLLVVLYDEHGGFFDRVTPPVDVPNPDGKDSADPPFDFTRLGVRVPAVLVSPWVEKGQVDSTRYEHASIPATLRVMFGLTKPLTARDQSANTFEKNFSLSTPRRDTPLHLPVPGTPEEADHHRGLLHLDALEHWILGLVDPGMKSQIPITAFQQSLVTLADILNDEAQAGIPHHAGQILHEGDAAIHIHDSLARVLKLL